ncbi:hypothetical protein DP106_00090 [Halonotius pteroides]|uniref:Uncharacterized protein n=1 Tax=Halonotius pteroides TaxID=268735 RepID=A0A3A6QSZ1_9EURY|nr:hypothetical protein DP106_00090 [Halonotius pteroides]
MLSGNILCLIRFPTIICRLKCPDQLARRRPKGSEMWFIKPLIESRRKREIWDENKVVVSNLPIGCLSDLIR